MHEFVNESNSKILLKRLSSKIDNLSKVQLGDRPKICKHLLVVYKMIASTVITNHFTNDNLYDQFSDILMLWCTFISKYMKLGNMDNTSLKKLILKFTRIPTKAKHLYKFCDILHENVSKNEIMIDIIGDRMYRVFMIFEKCISFSKVQFL